MQAEIDPGARAETLELSSFIRLSAAIKAQRLSSQ
jgi:hypothetical protein